MNSGPTLLRARILFFRHEADPLNTGIAALIHDLDDPPVLDRHIGLQKHGFVDLAAGESLGKEFVEIRLGDRVLLQEDPSSPVDRNHHRILGIRLRRI